MFRAKKVIDYATEYSGVSEKDLEGVTFTQVDAQGLVMDILTPSTILVGHALHNDLRTLKIDHKWVIDTSLLFRDPMWRKIGNDKPQALSLVKLCQAILKSNLREVGQPHSCIDDAIAPLQLVRYRLEHDVTHVNNLLLIFLQNLVR